MKRLGSFVTFFLSILVSEFVLAQIAGYGIGGGFGAPFFGDSPVNCEGALKQIVFPFDSSENSKSALPFKLEGGKLVPNMKSPNFISSEVKDGVTTIEYLVNAPDFEKSKPGSYQMRVKKVKKKIVFTKTDEGYKFTTMSDPAVIVSDLKASSRLVKRVKGTEAFAFVGNEAKLNRDGDVNCSVEELTILAERSSLDLKKRIPVKQVVNDNEFCRRISKLVQTESARYEACTGFLTQVNEVAKARHAELEKEGKTSPFVGSYGTLGSALAEIQYCSPEAMKERREQAERALETGSAQYVNGGSNNGGASDAAPSNEKPKGTQ